MRDGLARERLRLTLSANRRTKHPPDPFLCCDKNRASRRKLAKSQELNQHNVGKVRDFVLLFCPATSFCAEKCLYVSLFPIMYLSIGV